MTTEQTPVTPLTKRRVVLDLVVPTPADFAMYAHPDVDSETPASTIELPVIYLSPDDFRALGAREQVTITIEPGNLLNPPSDATPEPAHRTPCVDGSVCGGPHCPPAVERTASPAEHQLCGGEACETTGECQARSQCEYRTDAADEVTCPNCGRDHIPDEGDSHTTCVECQDGRGNDE